ncbi:sodium:proton antiporter [Rhodococcus sp. PAMC28707]|uniref:proton-conducting transporter transmembrane domain-containing protein n=1 Tax=unclassified Rhodococcus (in: high G+C Gram-positive bacteria) TaxID=192944 RepID=UPI00109DAC0D|nr:MULTISPECIES: proton-conducting transporter membrane subunit [unclassified Rhodococcus (in: high G+C Gram-positive bacteria)]QCB51265.1 sodium:proton antiporter [Rhodococcus sp. PAMC28705]QCB60567.1 sodium:proton antiporter [Rhodococcus sp. PAMC28707]
MSTENVFAAALIGVLVLPLLAAAAALGLDARRPRVARQLGGWVASGCFLVTGGLGIAVLSQRDVSMSIRGDDGIVLAGVAANRLGVLLMLLVFGVSAVAQSFAVRYLAGDSRARWFSASAGLLTSASIGLMISVTLIGLAVFWTMAGVALCLLLATYSHLSAARDGVRRTTLSFLVGDIALWLAVVLVTVHSGNLELATANGMDLGDSTLSAGAIACLFALAALSRSAQIPFHRWLPSTLAAPTPVSALLHAGVVNAGGVLLIRLGSLVNGSAVAMGLVVFAGAVTMIYGTLLMLTKPDIKGALTHSTMAQMGFMTLTCGLGLYAAAAFHLVAHGLYKATLFLSSGSAVNRHRRIAFAPPEMRNTRTRYAVVALGSVAVPALTLGVAVLVFPLPSGEHQSGYALLIFAWATAAAATMGWLERRFDIGRALSAVAMLAVASAGYVWLVGAVAGWMTSDLPDYTPPAAASWLIIAVAGVLVGVTVVRYANDAGPWGFLHRTLYVRALSAGHVSMPEQRSTRAVPASTSLMTGAHR